MARATSDYSADDCHFQEAIYELGVCDNGLLLGIDREEMDASLRTLERMADGLGARIKIIREVQVDLGSGSTTTVSPANGASANSVPSTETKLESWKVTAILNKEVRDRERLRAAAALGESERIELQPGQVEGAEVVYTAIPPTPTYLPDGRQLTSFGKPKALTRKLRRSIRREYGYPPRDSADNPNTQAPTGSVPQPWPSASPIEEETVLESDDRRNGSHDSTRHTGFDEGDDLFGTPETAEQTRQDGTAVNPASRIVDAAEEERLRIRRHLRKQWKKDKQAERRSEMQSKDAWPSRTSVTCAHSPNNRLRASLSATPEDRYMDALVSIFDGVALDPLTPEEEALYRTFGASGLSATARKKKKKKWRHRYNHAKREAELTGTPSEDAEGVSMELATSLPTDISWYDSPRDGVSSEDAASTISASAPARARMIPFSVPIMQSTSISSATTAENGREYATKRFAVECLVYIPEDEDGGSSANASGERGEEDQIGPLEEDEEEDPLFGGALTSTKPARRKLKSSTGRSGRPEVGSGKNSFMRQHYIDFENPDLILP